MKHQTEIKSNVMTFWNKINRKRSYVQKDNAIWQRLKIKPFTYFLNKRLICFQVDMPLT